MKPIRLTIATAIAFVLMTVPALAGGATLEEGATFFENNTCVEASGATGFAGGDGQCITAADYDAMYSVENLSTVASQTDPSQSIAEEAGLVDDGVAPSDRRLGAGLVEDTFTVNERLEFLFGDYPYYAFVAGTWYVF